MIDVNPKNMKDVFRPLFEPEQESQPKHSDTYYKNLLKPGTLVEWYEPGVGRWVDTIIVQNFGQESYIIHPGDVSRYERRHDSVAITLLMVNNEYLRKIR